MGEIINLRGGAPEEAPAAQIVDPEIIELIEAVLARARAGHVRGCAIATIEAQRETGVGWRKTPDTDLVTLIGATATLQNMMLNRFSEY